MNYTMFVAWIFYGSGRCQRVCLPKEVSRPSSFVSSPGIPLDSAGIRSGGGGPGIERDVTSTPRDASLGLGIVALGLPVYYLWRLKGPHPKS